MAAGHCTASSFSVSTASCRSIAAHPHSVPSRIRSVPTRMMCTSRVQSISLPKFCSAARRVAVDQFLELGAVQLAVEVDVTELEAPVHFRVGPHLSLLDEPIAVRVERGEAS